jgi:AP-3 complex subunit mu
MYVYILPDGTISNMPWRKTGVKYAQNEIYLDIIEEIDAIGRVYLYIHICK